MLLLVLLLVLILHDSDVLVAATTAPELCRDAMDSERARPAEAVEARFTPEAVETRFAPESEAVDLHLTWLIDSLILPMNDVDETRSAFSEEASAAVSLASAACIALVSVDCWQNIRESSDG